MQAEISTCDSGVVLQQLARCLRQHDLAAVTRGADASGAVHADADIIVPGDRGLASVDADAHPDGLGFLPRVASQRALSVDCRMYRILRTAERDK
jgi:hypothetical protein